MLPHASLLRSRAADTNEAEGGFAVKRSEPIANGRVKEDRTERTTVTNTPVVWAARDRVTYIFDYRHAEVCAALCNDRKCQHGMAFWSSDHVDRDLPLAITL